MSSGTAYKLANQKTMAKKDMFCLRLRLRLRLRLLRLRLLRLLRLFRGGGGSQVPTVAPQQGGYFVGFVIFFIIVCAAEATGSFSDNELSRRKTGDYYLNNGDLGRNFPTFR